MSLSISDSNRISLEEQQGGREGGREGGIVVVELSRANEFVPQALIAYSRRRAFPLYHSNRHSMPFHVVFSQSDWDIRRQSYEIVKTAA